jgi:23S rRNA (cytidine2498-2'-O)-methyltransferase
MLLTCQAGFESLLVRELAAGGVTVTAQGPGWALAVEAEIGEVAFAHLILREATELTGESVNQLAARLVDHFLQSLRGERIEAPWPCVFDGPAELVGLGRRVAAVEKAFHEALRKRLSRVAKLAAPELPRGPGESRGWFVWFTDFGCLQVARTARCNGQRRMADDDLAPSRSYLKVEEAYGVLGREPARGETVVDLGAAPGGWSYSAAKRGAHVLAIDNGPLKGGALGHPQIGHRREDAFRYSPPAGVTCDWLFCDMVEEPHHVLRHILEPWLERGWCRHFVVNLKFGRVDPIALLHELREPAWPWQRLAPELRVRHLYHDREEFTLTGTVRGGG